SSTRWNVRLSKYLALAFCSKLATVLLTPASASVCSLQVILPLAVSMTMYFPGPVRENPLAEDEDPLELDGLALVAVGSDTAARGVEVGCAAVLPVLPVLVLLLLLHWVSTSKMAMSGIATPTQIAA